MPITVDKIAKSIDRRSVLLSIDSSTKYQTKVMNLIYPESKRVLHPFTYITAKEMAETVGIIPLVQVGSSKPVPIGNLSQSYQEMTMPVLKTIESITAEELLRLDEGLADGYTLQDFKNRVMNTYIKHLSRVREILAKQSVSGSLAYKMQAADGKETTATLTLGTVSNITVGAGTGSFDWDNTATTSGEISTQIEKAFKYYVENVDDTATKASTILCLDDTAYTSLKTKAKDLRKTNNVEYAPGEAGYDFFFDGWRVVNEQFAWNDGTSSGQSLADKTGQFINLDNQHKFVYLKYPNTKNLAGPTLPVYQFFEDNGVPKGESIDAIHVSRILPLFNTQASAVFTTRQ